MRAALFPNAIIFTVATCVAVISIGAEPAVGASSVYKLRIEDPGAFLFIGRGPYVQAPAPRQELPIPAPLAGKPFAELIQQAARAVSLDPALVNALIYVESGYDPAARSPKGAVGLMQVLPETASRYGVFHPAHSVEANLRAGTRYLSDLLHRFDGRLDLALAAYNAGENAVVRHGLRIPPYPETRAYVPAVLAKYRAWQVSPLSATDPHRVHINDLPGTLLDLESVRAAAKR